MLNVGVQKRFSLNMPLFLGHGEETSEFEGGAAHVNERPVGARPATDPKYFDPNARTDRDLSTVYF